MTFSTILVTDAVAGALTAWAAGVSWDVAELQGNLPTFLVRTAYAVAAACLTVPVLSSVFGAWSGGRDLLSAYGPSVAEPVAVVGAASAVIVAVWSVANGTWAWPWLHRGVAVAASDAGAEHVGNVARTSGHVVGGTAKVLLDTADGWSFLFFPELLELEGELFLVAVGLAGAMLVLCPGVFLTGALVAWGRANARKAMGAV